jgi:hypothetical protein
MGGCVSLNPTFLRMVLDEDVEYINKIEGSEEYI